MTLKDFQEVFAPQLKEFLSSDFGNKVLTQLNDLRPPPICEPEPHQNSYRLGVMAGYEQCLFNLKRLSEVKPGVVTLKMNYGVKASESTSA